ncbi:Monocarboxylate transporter 10 [Armadillidium vulgare]|nr:Monocarboxylate transporter 10 [Armadillidium vulgare]
MGILVGTGSSLAYTPSLVILGHYFYKRIGIVNGFVTTGSSVFTILITELLKYVIEKHGLKAAFQILSGLMAILMFCGFIFKPLMPDISSPSDGSSDSGKTRSGSFLNTEIWKNKRYVIWAFAIPSALFGYFVPYMHLRAYATDVFGEEYNSKLLVQCIALTSGVGRLFFGVISDKPWVNRIVLQQAIGFLLALCSIPLTIGPFFAGYLYDLNHSYVLPFLLAGIPPVLGAFALFLIRCVKPPSEGLVGSPKHDMTEMKNNLAVTNPDVNTALSESQALMPNSDNQQSGNDLLQVDVRLLVNVQRESSV